MLLFPKPKVEGRTPHVHNTSVRYLPALPGWGGCLEAQLGGRLVAPTAPSLRARGQPTLWPRGEPIAPHPPVQRKRLAWMSQPLKQTPLSSSSAFPWEVGPSFSDPGPDISLPKHSQGCLFWPLSSMAPHSAAEARPTETASQYLQFFFPAVFHFLHDCGLLLTVELPIAPACKAQSSR